MDRLISQQQGGGGGPPSANPQMSREEQEEELQQQQKQRQEDFRNQVLNQVLDQQARARLATLSLAKPEKAQAVESLLINMARMGRFGGGGKIDEAQLIDILEKVGSGGPGGGNPMVGGGAGGARTGVTFTRRNLDDEEDDDEYSRIMEDL